MGVLPQGDAVKCFEWRRSESDGVKATERRERSPVERREEARRGEEEDDGRIRNRARVASSARRIDVTMRQHEGDVSRGASLGRDGVL